VLEAVLQRRLERAVEHRPVLGTALGTALEATGGDQQPLVGHSFEVMPQLVAAAQERHVRRVLVVRQPNDPRQTVRRPPLVEELELLQAEQPLAAPGQVIGRCGPIPPRPIAS